MRLLALRATVAIKALVAAGLLPESGRGALTAAAGGVVFATHV